MTTDFGNPFKDFLEGSQFGPRINYFSRIPTGLGFGRESALQGLFQPTFNRYLGDLGRQINAGQAPTLSFDDFLNRNFNFQRDLLHVPESSFSPRVTTPGRFFFGS